MKGKSIKKTAKGGFPFRQKVTKGKIGTQAGMSTQAVAKKGSKGATAQTMKKGGTHVTKNGPATSHVKIKAAHKMSRGSVNR